VHCTYLILQYGITKELIPRLQREQKGQIFRHRQNRKRENHIKYCLSDGRTSNKKIVKKSSFASKIASGKGKIYCDTRKKWGQNVVFSPRKHFFQKKLSTTLNFL
jgi:hypothetical protein